jgi:preprotein translocase subunit SecG
VADRAVTGTLELGNRTVTGTLELGKYAVDHGGKDAGKYGLDATGETARYAIDAGMHRIDPASETVKYAIHVGKDASKYGIDAASETAKYAIDAGMHRIDALLLIVFLIVILCFKSHSDAQKRTPQLHDIALSAAAERANAPPHAAPTAPAEQGPAMADAAGAVGAGG